MSASEIVKDFPQLTHADVYAALAYYWDHQRDLDREIARDIALVDELRRRTPAAPILAHLRASRAD